MYSQRFGVIQREIKGPTPKVVSVRAKPPKPRGTEQQVEKIQRKHQKYHATLANIKSREWDRLKVDWNEHSDRRSFASIVQARINCAMQEFLINTEERRNKLRELLAAEEYEYFSEMQSKGETIEEKKDKMREKTKLLREKKEKERQDFVAEKLDQQFREHCEDLRTQLYSIHEKAVSEERKAQVEFNEELRKRKLVEEKMFAQLWEEDRLAKEKREAQEERRQRELMENTRLGLTTQITSHLAQRQEAQRLKKEEMRLLEYEKAKIKFEDEQDKMKKQKAKEEMRSILQKALQEKMEHIQQEFREEQDLNMKLVQKAHQNLKEETEKNKQRKENMMREQKMYLEYLAQQHEEEKAQEKELDRILEEEKEKKWAEKDKQLRLEREARKQLLDEVMCTRQLQVQEKLQRKAKEQEDRAMEQKRIAEGLRELYFDGEENYARRCELAQEYKEHLQMQVAHQQQIREAEKAEQRREYEEGMAAQKAYEEKIQKILSFQPVRPQNIHPMRRACPNKLPL
ncbi:cilia- and flagella-associated protein 53 [Perognathus longimembris pacificus]|uniref:cilia- and flagella-associated protein 53 n=1 Tax=Perognathus longimembris pacificus TaxID=214514 RepID=UPI00201978F9|nr:cilia- and flagella-associated protein 53 [Perognathus longimembris pacificus]